MTGERNRLDEDDAPAGDTSGMAGATWTQAAQRHFDPDGEELLTYVVVSAIADARGVDARDVLSPPLYDVVDAAALETALFGTGGNEPRDPDAGAVEFGYEELHVTVQSDGWVRVDERTEPVTGRGSGPAE
jgi:hypothetical protein